VAFAGNRQIIWSGENGLYRWDLDSDEHHLIDPGDSSLVFETDRDGRRVVAWDGQTKMLTSFDLATGA